MSPARLAEVLWPDRPPRDPSANVATLVSRLRARLGPDVVRGGRQGYRIGDPSEVRVDVDDATELVARAGRRLAEGLAADGSRRAADLIAPLLG